MLKIKNVYADFGQRRNVDSRPVETVQSSQDLPIVIYYIISLKAGLVDGSASNEGTTTIDFSNIFLSLVDRHLLNY